jgi:N-acetyl-1-D-myo-inositol-2-amino-2-deoxy-alpha-D-glucopyranoside deacetylase
VTSRRLLLIHAHPDDETIGSGVTMARYVAEGATVTLLTCTLGELGEVLVPELAGIAADRGDQLGGYRIAELRDAMRELGVTDHRFLGGAGRWRDSGMIDTEPNSDPRAFWRCSYDDAAFAEAVDQAVAVIRETRPQVLITYDRVGGYGHPDHIMAHRVAMAASHRAARSGGADQPWQIEKIYWTAVPRSELQKGIDALRERGQGDFFGVESADELPFGNSDDEVTAVIDGRKWIDAKQNAIRAHATQIAVDGPFYALSNMIGQEIMGFEYFRLVRGEPAGKLNDVGRETDLFAGVDQ